MIAVHGNSPTVCFATFELNLQSRELRKHGMRLRLEEKPFQILELLLERAGLVVTRHSLREKLWPDIHVGYEHSLNTAINKLRNLLGDSAQNPRFIETLPRLGYRFIAPLVRPPRTMAPSVMKMLVVLPFEDLSGGTQEQFAAGLTEELISQVGRLDPGRLRVIARTSAMQYKGARKSVAEIAAELHAGFVLEGTVRGESKLVRISAQLVEACDQAHLWSATYDRDLLDALGVQADVARQVGAALAAELLGTGTPGRTAAQGLIGGTFQPSTATSGLAPASEELP
jgi:TolB-like protein/DNA-binding winged helix-turn-helix (wHTH) protein